MRGFSEALFFTVKVWKAPHKCNSFPINTVHRQREINHTIPSCQSEPQVKQSPTIIHHNSVLDSAYKDIKRIDGIHHCSLKTDCLTLKWSGFLKLMFLNLLRTKQADKRYYMNNNACVCSIWTTVPFAPSQHNTTVIRRPIPSNIIAHKFQTGSLWTYWNDGSTYANRLMLG